MEENLKKMARGEWGSNGRCSYKRTTVTLCSINIVVALYVLYSIYTSICIRSFGDNHTSAFRYMSVQTRRREESNEIRKALEPTELIKLAAKLQEQFRLGDRLVTLPRTLKLNMMDEILTRLRSLNCSGNTTEQREAVETWRLDKLKEAEELLRGHVFNSTILPEDASIIVRVLSSGWDNFQEEFGLWIPQKVINTEYNDKSEGDEEFEKEILPGMELPPECHTELHTDYDGTSVRWGLTHPKESAYDCCMSCLDQAKHAKEDEKKCNIWVYCPLENGCYSPDIYEHKSRECWLKFSETPKLNFKDRYSDSYRQAHPNAPEIVPWVSGVVSV